MIKVGTLTEDNNTATYVELLIKLYRANKAKAHSFKVPPSDPPVPAWLALTRRRFQDLVVDLLFRITKKEKTVKRLNDYLTDNGGFPPEYASLKLPSFHLDDTLESETFKDSAMTKLHNFKLGLLKSQCASEGIALHKYRLMANKTVVLEAYKTLVTIAYYETFHETIKSWKDGIHMTSDYQFLLSSVSTIVHKSSSAELEKKTKLEEAKRRAAEHSASLSVPEMVKEQVDAALKNIKKKAKPPKGKPSTSKPTGKVSSPSTSSGKQTKKKGKKKSAGPGTSKSPPAKLKGKPPTKKANKSKPLKGSA